MNQIGRPAEQRLDTRRQPKSDDEFLNDMLKPNERRSTFVMHDQKWPYGEDTSLSIDRMVEAGWYYCPSETVNDAVRCYCCFKSLCNWDPQDDPWQEHRKHSAECAFARYGKPYNELTLRQAAEVLLQRSQLATRLIIDDKIYRAVEMSNQRLKQLADELTVPFSKTLKIEHGSEKPYE